MSTGIAAGIRTPDHFLIVELNLLLYVSLTGSLSLSVLPLHHSDILATLYMSIEIG